MVLAAFGLFPGGCSLRLFVLRPDLKGNVALNRQVFSSASQ